MTADRESLFADLDALDALRMIAKQGECSLRISGPSCGGAVHSRRKRWDNPERVQVVGCAKHFAAEYLAYHEASEE